MTARPAGLAPALMVQGTASSVGKSLVATGLCRLFRQQGLRVLPFKAQNMALNAFVTPDGGEMGRAQAEQAAAAGVAPHVDMNPILIKPEGEGRAQMVVLGRPAGRLERGGGSGPDPDGLRAVIAGCLARLRRRCDLLIVEGAGSPAEINLKARDLVNMHVARAAGARVLLVGDIDRGGVFAALVGTMELLDPDERALVGGFVVNKFRGDAASLQPGLRWLEQRTGVPVLGVLPFLRDVGLRDEDSTALDERADRPAGPGELAITVVRLPHLSNHDDLLPLDREPGVVVRFSADEGAVRDADLVVLPGSKSTVADLAWLRARGLDLAIHARVARGAPVLAICGGCQMLAHTIHDPDLVEGDRRQVDGLGLLPLRVRFGAGKVTAQVRARAAAGTFLAAPDDATPLEGYEIHAGRLERIDPDAPAPFRVLSRNAAPVDELDGAVAANGAVVGTMLHGILDNASTRAALLAALRARRGLEPAAPTVAADPYDRLAAALRAHLDVAALTRLAGV